MSVEFPASTTPTAEQNVEVQQEASTEESTVEAEVHVEQPQDDIEGGIESSGSAAADDTSYESVADESTRPQSSLQDGIATGGAIRQESQESLPSSDGTEYFDVLSSTEFQQGGTSGGGSVMKSQQRGATGEGSGTESQQGGANSGTESQQGGANSGTESQQGGATGGTESQQGSSIGDSQETAAVGDTSSQVSLESGVAGDVSNSADSQESPANGTKSWECISAPLLPFPPAADAIPSGRLPTRTVPRGNEDEREQVAEDLMRGYEQCFSKCACICDYMRPCSRWIRKSKIFTFIRLGLAIIAIVAFALGISNLSRCPVKHELPILMTLLGIAGIILLVSSLALDWKSLLCPNIHRYYLTAGIVTARLMFLGLFGAVLNSTYSMSPSFDPESRETYCDQEFYYFAYYTNFIIAGIVVLAFFIYTPTANENTNDYERL